MSKEWQQSTNQHADPLSAYHNLPIVSEPGPNQKYIGRVIIELYEDGSTRSDASKIAYSATSVDGNSKAFALRVAQALIARLGRE